MKVTDKEEQAFIELCMQSLQVSLPAIFTRRSVDTLLGGVIKSGTLANMKSQGVSAPCICKGRNTVYEKSTFLLWLRRYLEGGIKNLDYDETKDQVKNFNLENTSR